MKETTYTSKTSEEKKENEFLKESKGGHETNLQELIVLKRERNKKQGNQRKN